MSETERIERVGFLTWFSVPNVAAPYADLAALAEEVGFPEDCVPTPPRPRNAWEKATGTGRRGINLEPPARLVERIQTEYGVEPKVRLVTRVIRNTAPSLVRHLVREAIISTADSPTRQLDMGTVAVLKFDTNSSESDLIPVPDPAGYINGDVRDVVREMDERIVHLMTYAVNDEIRYGIRALLDRLHRTSMRGSGGVYFIPAAVPNAPDQLRAMRDYIRGLERWKEGNDAPSCNVVTLRGSEAYDEIRDTVAQSAVEEYENRLEKLRELVDPVLEGRARGKVAQQINAKAIEEWESINAGLDSYRTVLRDGLSEMDNLIRQVAGQVSRATGWDETVRRVL